MSNIQITKIKLGKEGKLIYNRSLPNGKQELCELEILPPSPEIEEAAIALVSPAIEIIGLIDERWRSATVSSVSIKWDGDEFGVTIGLTNKEEYNGEPVCQNVPTRYVPPEQVDPDLRWNVLDVCKAAVAYIESQPQQLDLLAVADPLPSCEFEFAGVKP